MKTYSVDKNQNNQNFEQFQTFLHFLDFTNPYGRVLANKRVIVGEGEIKGGRERGKEGNVG